MTMFENGEIEAEYEEVKEPKYQWVMPFLLGLVAALVLSAIVAAAYVMKIGPFGGNARQDKIEASVIEATGQVDQQMDAAAMEQAAAAIGLNATGPQQFSIGQLQFGGGALQALNELAGAEASGAIHCQPSVAGLEGGARAALSQIQCVIAGAAANPAAPPAQGAPAAETAGQTTPAPAAIAQPRIALTFANGNVTSVTYAAAGALPAAIAPVNQVPTAPDASAAASGFTLPPSAPQPTNEDAAPANAPPAQ